MMSVLKMAIRLTYIRNKDKHLRGEDVLNIALKIENFLKENGITSTITISRYYEDRWYGVKEYEMCIKRDKRKRQNEKEYENT